MIKGEEQKGKGDYMSEYWSYREKETRVVADGKSFVFLKREEIPDMDDDFACEAACFVNGKRVSKEEGNKLFMELKRKSFSFNASSERRIVDYKDGDILCIERR